MNHDRNDVVIDLPEGRYTEEELKNIHKVCKLFADFVAQLSDIAGIQETTRSSFSRTKAISDKCK